LYYPNGNKYHATKTIVDNIKFDSKKEAKRYSELKLLQRGGEIFDLELQVPYILIKKSKYGRDIKYIADFVYKDKSGRVVVEDSKGVKTDIYKLKKRLMAEIYNIEIYES